MTTRAEIYSADCETINILLVEDNPADVRLLKEMLAEIIGVPPHLERVDRLSAGLERLGSGGIDVVLLDLSLPDSRGLSTLLKMQAHSPHLPNIVLTGLEDEALATRAVRQGAQDYLVKGQVDANLLLRAARYAIERKRTQEEIQRSYQIQTVLNELLRVSLENIPLEEMLERVIDHIVSIRWLALESKGGISLVEHDPRVLVMKAQRGLPKSLQRMCACVPFGRCICGQAALSRQVQFADCVDDRHENRYEGIVPHGHYCVPIISVGRVLGVIDLYLKEGHRREEKEEQFLRAVADVLAGAIERKRGEEEKQRLQEQLAHAQKMEAVGTLAGGIAHEFNNINAAIVGYIDFTLQTEELSSSARRNLKIVRSSVVRGAALTKNLLAFSRKEVGERKPFSLRDVVDDVLSVTEKEFTSEGIEVTVRHSMKVAPVMGDSALLSQVVMNLVINARHAMLKSAVKKLSVQTGVAGGKPFIRVKDTGCGIPKEHISRVFEPFFTTKGSLASGGIYNGKAHGTGLGLSVCHSIVEGHNGEIKVSSRVGKGTVFTVYLPAASEGEPVQPHAEPSRKESAARIMVVDDEKEITDLLVQILDRAGYAVDGFTNPREAIKALPRGNYAVAFVDLQMPEMAGEDFIRRLNRLPVEERPFNVILTGRLDNSQEGRDRLNVSATLHKPFSNKELLTIVEETLAAKAKAAARVGDKSRQSRTFSH